MAVVITNCAADWIPHTMRQPPLRERAEVTQLTRAAARQRVRRGRFGPQRLRLDLGNLDHVGI